LNQRMLLSLEQCALLVKVLVFASRLVTTLSLVKLPT